MKEKLFKLMPLFGTLLFLLSAFSVWFFVSFLVFMCAIVMMVIRADNALRKLLTSVFVLLSASCLFGQEIGDTVTLNGGGKLRDSSFVFSEPARVLLEGTSVVVLGPVDVDGYRRVKTVDGYVGYLHDTWVKWPAKKPVPTLVPGKAKKR